MANEKRLIDAEPIKKFIVDGLNNPDLKKAFGHDAIEILTEIEYAPTVDAVPVEKYNELKDRYKKLLETANILDAALRKYQQMFGDLED